MVVLTSGFTGKETQQCAERLLTVGNRPMPFVRMPSAASHRFDLGHMIGGIGNLHNQSPSLSRSYPNGIRRHHRPSRVIQLGEILDPSWVSADFHGRHRPAGAAMRRILEQQANFVKDFSGFCEGPW
jgi:hypothetical protein